MSRVLVALWVVICATIVSATAYACSVVWQRVVRESNAVQAQEMLKNIRVAETTFRSQRTRFGTLPDLISAGLVSSELADGVHADYRFSLTADTNTYEAVAAPANKDDTLFYVGRSYFVDQSGILRGAVYGKANNYRLATRNDDALRADLQ